ncbi:hypothetical protein GF340_04260 [Candidatus Peregrinibacteria bacterium]|nr:hypothetical protein [Candidatus Peregrinibacteria bacterium]
MKSKIKIFIGIGVFFLIVIVSLYFLSPNIPYFHSILFASENVAERDWVVISNSDDSYKLKFVINKTRTQCATSSLTDCDPEGYSSGNIYLEQNGESILVDDFEYLTHPFGIGNGIPFIDYNQKFLSSWKIEGSDEFLVLADYGQWWYCDASLKKFAEKNGKLENIEKWPEGQQLADILYRNKIVNKQLNGEDLKRMNITVNNF